MEEMTNECKIAKTSIEEILNGRNLDANRERGALICSIQFLELFF